MDVEDEASRCTMEATDDIMVEGTETGGVKAMRTGKGHPSRNAGTVARKATGRASAGKNAPIWREPVSDIPTREIGSDRTTLKDPEKPEKGLPS